MLNYMPEEMIIKILSWLPVKSLLVFKSVCKFWYSLISSQAFIAQHTKNQMITRYGKHYDDITREDHKGEKVLKSMIQRFKSKVLHTIKVVLENQQKHATLITTTKRSIWCCRRRYRCCYSRVINNNGRIRSSNFLLISNPYGEREIEVSLLNDCKEQEKSLLFNNEKQVISGRHVSTRMIGSCNGLICIYHGIDDIALWNPTIRDLKALPKSKLQRPPSGSFSDVGFGFDSCTNDYKVIQILYGRLIHRRYLELGTSPEVRQVEIYSLKTNSWRKYDHSIIPAEFRYIVSDSNFSMVHKNETFCWQGIMEKKPSSRTPYTSLYEDAIISFDMRDEVFRATPFPSEMEIRRHPVQMLPLHDSIALVSSNERRDMTYNKWTTYEIWSIRDLQATESWTKLANVGPLSGIKEQVGFWNNVGKFLILRTNSNKVVFYDFGRRRVIEMPIQVKLSYDPCFSTCVETLVSASGYNRRHS